MHNVEKWPNILKKCCGTFGHFSTLCKHFSTLCKKGLKQYFASYRLHGALYPVHNNHRVKRARIRSYSGPYLSAFGLNTDQNNAEYGHFLRSECDWKNLYFQLFSIQEVLQVHYV